MARPGRRLTAVALAMLAVVSIGGCTGTAADPLVEVSATRTRADEPVTIRVTGLRPGAEVKLAVRSTDADGVKWHSLSLFTANDAGIADPATQAPAGGGSYAGIDLMGPISSMRPPDPQSSGGLRYAWPDGSATFTITAIIEGTQPASRDVTRTLFSGDTERTKLSLERDGVVGSYRPAAGASDGDRPAVQLIGGAEGGVRTTVLGDALAERGLATLSIGYFGLPGLPETLNGIPVEYFTPALSWLRSQPGVDSGRIWVMGVSRGSEIAQLVAIDNPELVHGVLVTAPSSVLVCGFPDCDGPAWTSDGKPLPWTTPGNPHPVDESTNIAIEKFAGPVLAVCGGADTLWPSCGYGRALMARLEEHGHDEHRLWSYPDAGHGIGGLLPYTPAVEGDDGRGSSPEANRLATADVWPQVIDRLTAA